MSKLTAVFYNRISHPKGSPPANKYTSLIPAHKVGAQSKIINENLFRLQCRCCTKNFAEPSQFESRFNAPPNLRPVLFLILWCHSLMANLRAGNKKHRAGI